MKRIVVPSLSVLLLLGSCNQKIEEPNVLVIMCDQLNIQALSCYGGAVSTLAKSTQYEGSLQVMREALEKKLKEVNFH